MPRPQLIVALALALCLAPGCRKRSAERPLDGVGKRTLAVATFEPKSFDPHKLADGLGVHLVENLFEGLLALDASGKPVPGAAARWATSQDGLTWTFTLRPGLTWSDGQALTAEDFVWSFRRAVSPDTANPQVSLLFGLAGAEEAVKGGDVDGLGVRAPEPDTLVIQLKRPNPDLPRLLAMGYTVPVPRHAVDKHGDQWTRPGHMVSNGPYLLASHKHEQQLVLNKNPRFHGADSLALEEVTLRFTTSHQQAWHWYQLGEVDIARGLVPPDVMLALRKKAAPDLRIDPYDGLFYLLLNTRKPPLSDFRVRRAVELGLDRPRLVRQVLSGGERPATMMLPGSMTAARVPARVRHDPEAARKLLAEAGVGALKLELMFNTNEKNRRIAEFLQRSLKESIGAEVVVRNVEWKTFLEEIRGDDYQVAQLNTGGFDAADFLSLLESEGPGNWTGFSSAGFDAALKRVRRAATTAERDRAIGEALAIADREVPLIPVFQMTRQSLVRPGLSGYEPTPDDRHPYRYLSFETKP